jgi:hypothetical protein
MRNTPDAMNDRGASRAVSKIATPKNGAASCGVFIIPRERDKINSRNDIPIPEIIAVPHEKEGPIVKTGYQVIQFIFL